MSRAELMQEVARVFAEVPRPSDDKIVGHHCEDCDEIEQSLRGTHWSEWGGARDYDALVFPSPVFPLLTPEAFHYYMPAFLKLLLEKFETPDAEASKHYGYFLDCYFYTICPDRKREFWRPYCSRMAPFSLEQLEVIAACLAFLRPRLPESESDFKLAIRLLGERPWTRSEGPVLSDFYP